MSWRSWIVLSLAWETSLSLVSAVAVTNRGSGLDFNMKTSNPACGTCDLTKRDQTDVYDQCNFWGDPHVTARFGDLKGKDYQGGGVQDVIRTQDVAGCNQLEMQAFQCQYKRSQNTVMLGALVKITVSGTEVEIYIKPDTTAPTPGLSVTVSPLNVVTVTVSSNGKKVTISSPDECLYLYIDLKTITVAPKYILNLKSRVLKDLPIIGSNGGYCGAEPPNTASVTDSSNWLFTPEQHQELCDLCSAGGAQITPPGCGPAPPATDPVGLPRCSFADAIVADDNVIRWECTGTVQDRAQANLGPRLPGSNECVFGYQKTPTGSRVKCSEVCELVGGTCTARLNREEECNGDTVSENDCDREQNDGACYCSIPDSLLQGEGPTVDQLLDQNGVEDANKAAELENVRKKCTEDDTNDLKGTDFPPDANDPTANELVLEGCIKDILSLGPATDRIPADEQTAVDNAKEFEENQPSGDDCSSFTCPVDRPAITPEPSCNGECNVETCCVPTCGSFACNQPGFTDPTSDQSSTPCNSGTCDADTCCSPTCNGFACGQGETEAPANTPCGAPGSTCGAGVCCAPITCGSTGFAVCDQPGFVNDSTKSSTPCSSGTCDTTTCCSQTCEGFDVKECGAKVPAGTPASIVCGSAGVDCTPEKCCVPTCGSTSDVCSGEGVTPDTNLTSTPCGDLRGGNCTTDTCCSKTCADFDCGVNASLRQPPRTCGPAGTPCSDTLCCEPTCASHTCTKAGFVPNETAKAEVCTGSNCGDDQCCQPTCRSFDCPANFVKNQDKNPALCPDGKCDKVFCCLPTCGSYVKCAQEGFVPDDSKTEVVCSSGTCDDATCCQPTCLSYEKCTQQGFVKDSAKDSKKCLPGGCDDITCCEATCATYKHCRERRTEPDPKKATLVCGPTANKCNDNLCCAKRGQLRRNGRHERREGRRNGHYGHYAYEPGAAKLIDAEELAFLQESNFVDEDEEEESEEL